jgi:hypothetical protein
MCPFCLASMGLIVASAAASGGLAAMAVKISRNKNGAGQIVPDANERKNQDVNEHDSKSQNSVAR